MIPQQDQKVFVYLPFLIILFDLSTGIHTNSSTNSLGDNESFLEGAIVLEEFCKELAAIAFVKHHSIINKTTPAIL